MFLIRWLAFLIHARKPRPGARRTRLEVECLEGRAVPAVLNVTTTADVIDPNDGALSLREAIIQSNASNETDTIALPAGTYTLALAGANEDAAQTGDLDIAGHVQIQGAGAGATVIDGAGLDRVLHVLTGADVSLDDLTVQGGLAESGGGILNGGILSLDDCTVSGNTASQGFGGTGGGILNGSDGKLRLDGCTISGNSSDNEGGGIHNAGQLTARDTTFSGNTAPEYGGGLSNAFPVSADVDRCIFTDNAAHEGGGIYAEPASFLSVSRSTFSGNSGGDISAVGANLKLQNNTFGPAAEPLAALALPVAGSLDPAFAGDGVVTTSIGLDGDEKAFAAAVYPGATPADDGKVIAAGTAVSRVRNGSPDFDFALIRYNPDGTPDTSFGQNGQVITNVTSGTDAALAVRLVGNKILAGGYAESGGFALARYTAAGTLDPTFGKKGIVLTKVNGGGLGQAMEVDAAGRIVMAGTDGNGNLAVARYTSTGALDTTFGRGGVVTAMPAQAGGGGGQMGVALVPATAGADAGKIVVVGVRNDGTNRVFAARFTAAGALDPTFGVNGVTDLPASGSRPAVAVQPDGRVVVAAGQDVFRLTADGALDPTFDGDGQATTTRPDNASAVALLPDGKILVSGIETVSQVGPSTWGYFVTRYTPDGAPDPTYGNGGVAIETEADPHTANQRAGLAVQANGKAVVAGNSVVSSVSDFAVTRFLGDNT